MIIRRKNKRHENSFNSTDSGGTFEKNLFTVHLATNLSLKRGHFTAGCKK